MGAAVVTYRCFMCDETTKGYAGRFLRIAQNEGDHVLLHALVCEDCARQVDLFVRGKRAAKVSS